MDLIFSGSKRKINRRRENHVRRLWKKAETGKVLQIWILPWIQLFRAMFTQGRGINIFKRIYSNFKLDIL